MTKPKCKFCNSRVQYRGTRRGAYGVEYKRYKCTKCKKWDKAPVDGSHPRTPSVLLFDI